MSPRFVLGRENVPCVAEVVNRSLKADCTDFTNVRDTRSKPFVLMSVVNTIPNRINVVIKLKSIFFIEKFLYSDIEISENKKTIRDFKLDSSKAFL